jgi:DNA invertase Pin-like site-specific DNA recombinase
VRPYMSESEAVKGIRRAAKRREYADRLRHQATDELRERIREAQAEGVSIARIAREARLSRQGVYDLLVARAS